MHQKNEHKPHFSLETTENSNDYQTYTYTFRISSPIRPASFAVFILLVVIPFFAIIHLLPENLLRPYVEKEDGGSGIYSFLQKPTKSQPVKTSNPKTLKNALKALVDYAEEYHEEKDIAEIP